MVNKYVKKPVQIEAIQYTGDNIQEIRDWSGGDLNNLGNEEYPTLMEVVTLEGSMLAVIGDYIIKGVEGEIYPCKQSIFEKTYNLVQ